MSIQCRLIMLSDLVVDDHADSILGSIGITEECYYPGSPPEKCGECGSDSMEEVEILGTDAAVPLFWECQSCDKLYLMSHRIFTEEQLSKAHGTWTVPQDWERKDPSEYN